MLDTNFIANITATRKALHAHPEVSGEEVHTQKGIIRFLKNETNSVIEKITKTGVLATFSAVADGPAVMIRGL